MREEWIEIEGGNPALKLWPETEVEAALRAVERALLGATLAEASRIDAGIHRQIEQAVCACRHLTGYGMYLEIALPSDSQPSQSVRRTAGGATLTWRDTAKAPLAAVAFFKDGLLEFLEVFPSDGEGWSVDECRTITSASLDAVEICAEVDRDLLDPGLGSAG